MTNKILYTSLLLGLSLLASKIPTLKVQHHAFNKSVALNAQIIQLANAEQSITSLVDGHLEKYYVKPAQKVKAGQKVALIESIVISKMSANFLALKKQLKAVSENYEASKKLYEKGITSMQKLNNQKIKKSEINAQLTALKSQLQTLGINGDKLTKPRANFVLYAHSAGTVSQLLKPLHSSVTTNEAVISIVKNQAYYVKSFLPIEYATKVRLGDKIVFRYNKKNILTHITQVLPKLDEVTQRVVVLSSVDEEVHNLFINTYVKSTLYFAQKREYLAVKKSALSFFNNEWVVFVPKGEEHEEHGEVDDADEHEGDEHEESFVPYTLEVVDIITQDEEYVAIEGLHEGEEYVSENSYYVKSMILKSSLGGHEH
jgi:multidrug efflux pump subunit AcrA (membrane-fusion protein)